MNKKLELIDFSQGIRSTEIQHNFSVIQEQINKERISVAGSGISYGLNFNLKDFDLEISNGCLIDKEGKEVYIDRTVINIDKPILIAKQEILKTIDDNHRIFLSEIPYANNRVQSADQVAVADSGVFVNISNMTGSSSVVSLANIDEKVVTLNGNNLSGIKVDVRYSYTARRRDIIFIDKEYKIQYRKGITSTSPSIPKLRPDEFTYILGYIEVNGLSRNSDNKVRVKVEVIKEFRSTRNVYTDDNNKLYLCGTPFESIKIIHTTEPKNPTVDTFWYDESCNKLKVWRRTDMYEFADAITFTSIDPNHPQKFNTNISYAFGRNEMEVYINNKKIVKGTDANPKDWQEGSDLTDQQKQEPGIESSQFHISKKLVKGDKISYVINKYDGFEEWVCVNDSSYVPCNERYIWTPEYLENEIVDFGHDKQHFFFDAEKRRSMLFVPGKNSLEIMIDQVPLHNDQFDELTMYNAITGSDAVMIKHQLLTNYNFKDNFDPDLINDEYENIGVGFKLNEPLQKKCYVEARVTHRVNAAPLSKRFQRTATFVNEGSVTFNVANKIITTTSPYRVQEFQLEVFLNGKKLILNKDFKELSTVPNLKGSTSNTFEILTDAKNGDIISYRITTTVYSYDHLDGLLSKFDRRIKDVETNVDTTLNLVNKKIEYIDRKIGEIDDQLDALHDIESNLDTRFLKKTDRIGKENLRSEIFGGIAEKTINQTYSISKVPQSIDVTSVCSKNDFVILYNITGNRILQRGSDYNITESNGAVALSVTSMAAQNSTLYLSGIKFNRA